MDRFSRKTHPPQNGAVAVSLPAMRRLISRTKPKHSVKNENGVPGSFEAVRNPQPRGISPQPHRLYSCQALTASTIAVIGSPRGAAQPVALTDHHC
jgi:hypothetical protein